ncbi:hypothetical protein ECSTECEH250_1671 [Escherichia coli STEC_EH250]|nr:hypothetical protein ECSTECEH250_1671 [Escherichia coli STEC_EH250]EIH22410.1 hypothetical protein EC12264_1153 [Escherichia coli 1.2264]EIH25761.1 hypothetical protein EC12264_2413 [Escherichia coli 1.2264]EIH25777.1 hypothetical protein EC12264_1162 [Escherichia coli 1.2264]EIH46481.1 hypothetical protein EC970259_5323 [Escherichia coli 99.0741]
MKKFRLFLSQVYRTDDRQGTSGVNEQDVVVWLKQKNLP